MNHVVSADERPCDSLSTELTQPMSAGVIVGCAPGGLLALPKPKLAPIASCETLSESFDMPTGGGSQLVGGTSSGGSSLGSSPVGSLSDDSNSGSWYQTPAALGGPTSVSGPTTAITIVTSSDSAFSSLHRRSMNSSPRSSIDDTLPSGNSVAVGTVGGRCGGCGSILVVGDGGLGSPGSTGTVPIENSCLLVPSGSESGLSSCDTLSSGYHPMSAAASSDTLVPGSPSFGSSLSGSPTAAASTNSVASSSMSAMTSNSCTSSTGMTSQHQTSNSVSPSAQQQQSSSLKRQLAALLLVNFRGGSGNSGSGGRKSRGSGSSVPAATVNSTSSSAASLQSSHQLNALALSPATSPKFGQGPSLRRHQVHHHHHGGGVASAGAGVVTLGGHDVSPWELSPDGVCAGVALPPATRRATSPSPLRRSPVSSPKMCRAPSPISYSYSSPNIITNLVKPRPCTSCTVNSTLIIVIL